MTKNTTRSGNQAEQAVAEELVRLGYKIIELNWKTPYAEIDIVANKKKTIYFVEVKYRATSESGDGLDYITTQKLYHMQRAAEVFVSSSKWAGEFELLAAAVMGTDGKYIIDIRPLF